jgi:hypothetical protein
VAATSRPEQAALRRRRRAERQKAWRDRQRRGIRSYPVQLRDADVAEMIDRGVIGEIDALDPEMVARTIERLAKAALQKIVTRNASGPKSGV